LLLASACVADSGGDASPASVLPSGRQQLSGHLTPEIARAPVIERVPAATPMRLAFSLPVRDQRTLREHVRKVSDPDSPSYRAYLTTQQFADSYGTTASEYQALVDWATAHGLDVERTYANRLVLTVSSTADVVEKALHVEVSYRARPDGTRFLAPDREPSIELDVPVLHVDGLSDFEQPKPACFNSYATGGVPVCLSGSGPQGGYTNVELRNAYLGATSCASLTGKGQRVVLVEHSGYTPQDITAFATATGLAANVVAPLGNNPKVIASSPGDNSHGEVALDIDMVWSMAPDAEIDVYEAPSLNEDLAAIATTNPLPLQVSNSWFDAVGIGTQDLLDELALQGQSYFEASGDKGGYTTTAQDTGDVRTLDAVTVVGGTDLGVNPGASPGSYYQEEAGWSYSGGGYLGPSGSTPGVPIPYYQQRLPATGPGFSTQYRNLPDVALTSELVSIYYSPTASSAAQNYYQDGTSAAAPLWAGVMALVNQQNPSNPVGFANPALYALGKANAGYFHDISVSDIVHSSEFTAAPGYDLVTGWGTPTCSLIKALASNPVERRPTALMPSGFKTWGGAHNLCMAPAGDRVAAGVAVVSEPCNSTSAQNWVLTYGHGAISPATNTGLCLDIQGNPASGSVVLNPCNESMTQSWSVGSAIQNFATGQFRCLGVESTVAGDPLAVSACTTSIVQSFWPWGFPLSLMNVAGDQCLNNPGDGQTLNDANCRPNAGTPPLATTFILTQDNRIVASGGFTSKNGTGMTAGSACVNLDGLGINGQSPTQSQLSTWTCGVAYASPALTFQDWFFVSAGEHNGTYSWTTIRSLLPNTAVPECIDVQGASPNPNTPVDVAKCSGTVGQAWEPAILLTDEIGFPGY
jgi:hypothetical protein